MGTIAPSQATTTQGGCGNRIRHGLTVTSMVEDQLVLLLLVSMPVGPLQTLEVCP